MSGVFDSPRRLSTGVEALDRALNGGLLPGTVVAFVAPPASQSELLLYELCDTRETLYLSTARSEQMVADAIDRNPKPEDMPAIRLAKQDAPLENARRHVHDVAEEMNLIVDPIDELELAGDRARYQNLLNALQNHMQNTNSVAVIHCLGGGSSPPLRDLTLHMADAVMELDVEVIGSDVESRLAVTKFRGGRPPRETLKLEFAERVRVDTSRDIA